MLSVSIGPLALPVAPLLLLAAVWLAAALAGFVARRVAGEAALPARQAVFHAALLGLLGARVVHVAEHADAYLGEPWRMIDLRDGGWHLLAGALAGAAWLAWQAARQPAWRRALTAGVLAGTAAWTLGTWATGRFDAPPLPTVPLQDLAGAGSTPTVLLARWPRGARWWSTCGPAGAARAARRCPCWRRRSGSIRTSRSSS